MSVLTTKDEAWEPSNGQEARDFTGTRPRFVNLKPNQGCAECDNPRGGPQHFGSPLCQSSSLAAPGGFRAHCSCDGCY